MNLARPPLVTIVLISFNQVGVIRDAVQSVLAQDYPLLEICISDDASTDGTWEVITETVLNYAGPHRVSVWRNEKNLGIGANLHYTVRRSEGELIFIAAGDDISLPERVRAVTDFWLECGCQPDLIASYLYDMTLDGQLLEVIAVSDLSQYRSLEDWIAAPPRVIGAGQAWTRRLFDRFDGIPEGVVGEDMVMAFRAVSNARAVTFPHPMVFYRRGGLTNQGKALSAEQVIDRLTRKIGSSLIELNTMRSDASSQGAGQEVRAWLDQKIRKEEFIAAMFKADDLLCLYRVLWDAGDQPFFFKIRIWAYARVPWLLSPFFWLKRRRYTKSVSSNRCGARPSLKRG